MAFVLRKVGDAFEVKLGKTGVVAHAAVPSLKIGKKVRMLALAYEEDHSQLEKFQRQAYGLIFNRLDGVQIGDDGDESDIELDKDENGYLSDKALELIRPLNLYLRDEVFKMIGLSKADEKN